MDVAADDVAVVAVAVVAVVAAAVAVPGADARYHAAPSWDRPLCVLGKKSVRGESSRGHGLKF